MTNRGILYALAFSFLLFSCESEVTTDEPQVEITTEVDSTEFFENAIIANSKTPAPYIDRAGWYLRNGRIKEGLNDLDMALDADSTYGPAWSAKSDVLYLAKKFISKSVLSVTTNIASSSMLRVTPSSIGTSPSS